MSDRRLIVGEFDPAEADNGKLFAIDPTDAKGIPLPAFDVGNARPTVGTLKGQAYFDTNQKQGFCWTGSAWQAFAPSPLLTYATESDLLKDTRVAVGGYATAGDSGALFVRGAHGWREVGIKSYNTATDLFGDNPAPGSLGEVLNEGSLWERKQGGWRLLIVREMPDTPTIVAWDRTSPGASKGDQAYDKQHDVLYVRTSKHWRPVSIWEADEATIRAATWCLNGQEAVAGDTGRTFTRIRDQWIEEPINHFATEALLLAATAVNGTLAWADDTNVVFTRAGNAWHRLQGPQVSVGDTQPTTPGAGDQWYKQTRGQLTIWDGTKWRTSAPADNRAWEADVVMGANATVGNQIILAKNITPANDGVYITIVDSQVGHNSGRSAFAIHCFATDSVGNASAAPVHMEVANTRFSNLHWFWKDSTDSYVIAATISEACVGATFKVGMFSATADLSAVKPDGFATSTDGTAGTVIEAKAYPLRIPAGTANDQVLKWDGDSWEATSLSTTGASKLIAKKDLAFHHFDKDTWQEVYSRWVKPSAMGVPVGHLVMVIMSIKVKKYHGGSIKLSSLLTSDADSAADAGWTEYASAGTAHELAGSIDRTLVCKIDDAERKIYYAANSYGVGGNNGDRQGWGYIAMWDMGPEPTADM